MLGEFSKMKFLILFLILFSCSTSKIHKPDFWWVLENYNSSWDSKQIISMLGKPGEISQINGEDNWIYTSSKTNNQNWAIGVSKEDKVTGLAYIPDEELYIMDIENRWKSKKCEHKKETKLTAGHNYQTIRTFICENGKIEVFYSRFNEVQRIYLK
jgi:hypothetical protein